MLAVSKINYIRISSK